MTNTGNKTNLKFRLSLSYFLVFLLIFVIEVIIALFARDRIIRPYGGDILVVVLMYYFWKSFLRIHPLSLAVGVLLFAYAIEAAQYFNVVEVLNLQSNTIMRTVIGSTFSWGDIVCYTVGAILCLWIDRKKLIKDS